MPAAGSSQHNGISDRRSPGSRCIKNAESRQPRKEASWPRWQPPGFRPFAEAVDNEATMADKRACPVPPARHLCPGLRSRRAQVWRDVFRLAALRTRRHVWRLWRATLHSLGAATRVALQCGDLAPLDGWEAYSHVSRNAGCRALRPYSGAAVVGQPPAGVGDRLLTSRPACARPQKARSWTCPQA
jgi:hypothetical protein